MKLITSVQMNLVPGKVGEQVAKATQDSLRDVTVAIANDAKKGSPRVTGNNSSSIWYEVGPGGRIATRELEGAVYSTSGYGGFLETGTVNMAAQPYFKPALDKNIGKLPQGIKAHLR